MLLKRKRKVLVKFWGWKWRYEVTKNKRTSTNEYAVPYHSTVIIARYTFKADNESDPGSDDANFKCWIQRCIEVGTLDLTLFDSFYRGWCFFLSFRKHWFSFVVVVRGTQIILILRWHLSFTYCFDCCQSYEKKKKPSTLTILQRNWHKFWLFGCALFMPTF